MAEPTTLNVSVDISDVIAKIKHNLALVGKRAKMTDGTPMFSDLTVSSAEDTKVFPDLIESACQTIISELAYYCGSYTSTSSTITFKVTAYGRWSEDEKFNLSSALEGAIENYIFSYAVAEYLSIIHPGTGDKYPPRWGQPFTNRCTLLLRNIVMMCNLKRSAERSTKNITDVNGKVLYRTSSSSGLLEDIDANILSDSNGFSLVTND